ncbi:MAG: VOC family protein [Solirubrobacterales bacterium]
MAGSTLNPYLSFQGNTREAMEFYHSIFGGDLNVQTVGESPMESPPEAADSVMHAQLSAGAITIMAADAQHGMQVNFGNSVNLSLVGEDEAELKSWFDALGAGGQVSLPLEKQFWGDTFGMLTDKFGINWMVNVVSAENAEAFAASQSG